MLQKFKTALILMVLVSNVACATVEFNSESKVGRVVAADISSVKKTITSQCYPLKSKIDSIEVNDETKVSFHCVPMIKQEVGSF